jgi:predicted RNA-binding Zn-ribbon protein involved in translation (DUF1610 family)
MPRKRQEINVSQKTIQELSKERKKIHDSVHQGARRFCCPRCEEIVTQFPALSRLDNKTEICSACGFDEAMENWATGKITDWRSESCKSKLS